MYKKKVAGVLKHDKRVWLEVCEVCLFGGGEKLGVAFGCKSPYSSVDRLSILLECDRPLLNLPSSYLLYR